MKPGTAQTTRSAPQTAAMTTAGSARSAAAVSTGARAARRCRAAASRSTAVTRSLDFAGEVAGDGAAHHAGAKNGDIHGRPPGCWLRWGDYSRFGAPASTTGSDASGTRTRGQEACTGGGGRLFPRAGVAGRSCHGPPPCQVRSSRAASRRTRARYCVPLLPGIHLRAPSCLGAIVAFSVLPTGLTSHPICDIFRGDLDSGVTTRQTERHCSPSGRSVTQTPRRGSFCAQTQRKPMQPIAETHQVGPDQERDACALIVNVRKGGGQTHGNVKRTLEALLKMGHRTGEVDGEGDGCGLLTDIPRRLWGGLPGGGRAARGALAGQALLRGPPDDPQRRAGQRRLPPAADPRPGGGRELRHPLRADRQRPQPGPGQAGPPRRAPLLAGGRHRRAGPPGPARSPAAGPPPPHRVRLPDPRGLPQHPQRGLQAPRRRGVAAASTIPSCATRTFSRR